MRKKSNFFRVSVEGVVIDPDAQLFVTNANITDATQITAIDNLVINLKANNLWDKIKAIYPMIGGTAFSHKFNLKDPRDLDIAFRLNFIGTWTHTSNGAMSSVNDGYASTNLNPFIELNQNSVHISYYCRTPNINSTCLIGAQDGATNNLRLIPIYNATKFVESNSTSNTSPPPADNLKHFFLTTRENSNSYNYYIDGALNLNSVIASTPSPNLELYLNGGNVSGTVYFRQAVECAGATVGVGLTGSDQLNLYNSLQTFNTELSRNN